MSLKRLNQTTEYEVIPSYSVLIIQDENRVVVTAQEIARLHVESSVAPDQPEPEKYDARRDGIQA